jgi:hypothetical protein
MRSNCARHLRGSGQRGVDAPGAGAATVQCPPGHAQHQDPRGEQPQQGQVVSAEGHRAGASRQPQCPDLRRRRGGAWAGAAQTTEKRMPRKMRRAALRSALSAKAGEQQIVVLDELELERPRRGRWRQCWNGGHGAQRVDPLPERTRPSKSRRAICPGSRPCAPAI